MGADEHIRFVVEVAQIKTVAIKRPRDLTQIAVTSVPVPDEGRDFARVSSNFARVIFL